MKIRSASLCAFCAAFGFAVSALAADTYTWTATGDGVGSASYVKILDDVGAFNGRLRLVGFSTAEGEYTVTSNRLFASGTATTSTSGLGELPTGAYVYQMSCGARYDGATTKSIRVQLAQPSGSTALYARITAIATANGDHTAVPDLRVAIKDEQTVEGTNSEAAADLLANAVTKIVVGVANETIAYWPFGENGFSDVSGNGHDLEGVEVAESDAAYMSLNDGRTDQYLKTASALDLSKETAVTFECWWRKTSAHSSGKYPMLMASAHVGSNDLGGFFLSQYGLGTIRTQYRSAASSWQMDYTNDNDPLFVGGMVNDGMWHHVAYVVNRTEAEKARQCRLYVDGTEVAKAGTFGTVPDIVASLFNDYFVVGGGTDYTSDPANAAWQGYIDDVRICRGVVAPEDFLKYPTVGKTMRADNGKLPVLAYWPFGGKYGKDVTGNGFDLTMADYVKQYMISGTPSFTNESVLTSWSGDFKCESMPFSAFSKTGVTIEFFAKTESQRTDSENVLSLTPTHQYWANAGAFRVGPNGDYEGAKSMGVVFRCKESGKYMSSTTTPASFGNLNDGKWRHYAVIYDPSKTGPGIVTLYVDGVAAGASTTDASQGAVALADTTLYFQRIKYGTTINSGYSGSFDDVRITAGVLTPDKFLSSRSAASTIALYRFDNGSAEDVSGNGHSVTFEGGNPVFEDTPIATYVGCYTPGLRMDGAIRFYTTEPVDLTHTKAITVEYDYNRKWNNNSYAFVASADHTVAGGFSFSRESTGLRTTLNAKNGANSSQFQARGTATNGYFRGRHSINGYLNPIALTMVADENTLSWVRYATIDSFGNQKMYFGGCPTYYDANRFVGYFYRIAISDVKLDPADYVLDNLIDPETKRTLAYWDFRDYDGLTVVNGATRGGGLELNGNTSAATTNLTLSALTQATIECFVCFGREPSSGSIFSMGSGVGSFAVAADATAGTLNGTFIPYDHLAASNGGTAALAPLAGRKAWHHVALVIDRTKSGADAVRFYVDYERAMPAGRAWDKAATMLDGALTLGAGFSGRIDDLRVSAGALSPSEFMQAEARTYVPDGMSVIIR